MMSKDFNSFKFGYGLSKNNDSDELSDDDEGGSEANDGRSLTEDYFTGHLSDFAAGLQPSAEEVKNAHGMS